jgi:hypothetical protein
MQLGSRRQAGEQPGREHGDSRDPGITRQMTSPAARVIADEAWAKLLWAGLKLQAAGFGNADSYYPQSGSTRMTEASALTKRRDATSPAQEFSGIVAGEVSIRRWPLRSGSEGRPETGPG